MSAQAARFFSRPRIGSKGLRPQLEPNREDYGPGGFPESQPLHAHVRKPFPYLPLGGALPKCPSPARPSPACPSPACPSPACPSPACPSRESSE
ncbi:hypothetical protein CHLRE_31g758347v5 [Chlamydomonas reinhardtii]|uniref:Uncharacterized protein n=1 Tax=Chlamydomonas reinhardtii TaxID=3055 RepID=A0A2K3CMX7_CHLRE|nr:uncharacterized protein CHLRE_31g758347v5 [Chlamydomonas reinhardtii]PNW69637.1 hypothetical protein CHLRE_31g758347v5 [Chlamydomonas reinhardtii]